MYHRISYDIEMIWARNHMANIHIVFKPGLIACGTYKIFKNRI